MFQLLDGSYSVSDIQNCINYIIKKHETFTTNPPMNVYINRINNRLVFKIKDKYRLELHTPETMKLLGKKKKIIGKTNNGENVPSLGMVEACLVQCNLVDKQYQQKYDE